MTSLGGLYSIFSSYFSVAWRRPRYSFGLGSLFKCQDRQFRVSIGKWQIEHCQSKAPKLHNGSLSTTFGPPRNNMGVTVSTFYFPFRSSELAHFNLVLITSKGGIPELYNTLNSILIVPLQFTQPKIRCPPKTRISSDWDSGNSRPCYIFIFITSKGGFSSN